MANWRNDPGKAFSALSEALSFSTVFVIREVDVSQKQLPPGDSSNGGYGAPRSEDQVAQTFKTRGRQSASLAQKLRVGAV